MDWDQEVDVIVVGSGGGALTGAYMAAQQGLDTMVIESTEYFGGTTAYSGGGLWLPGNQALRRGGVEDSADVGREYLRAAIGESSRDPLIEAFSETAPVMVELLEENPLLEFEYRPFPDYFPSAPGFLPMGRDIFPKDLPGADLGDLLERLRPTMGADRYGDEVPRDVLSGGQALIARLLLACSNAGVSLRTRCGLETLITDENGDVIGVEAASESGTTRLRARRGVLLAAGGFERNDELRRQYQAPLGATWSNGASGSLGRPILAGAEVGGALEMMEECWWCAGLLHPDGSATFIVSFSGGILVNGDGLRYADEGLPYDRLGREMRQGLQTDVQHVPSYLIFDGRSGAAAPALAMSSLPPEKFLEAGVWKQAGSLAELAEQIGVPKENLVETVDRWNGFVETGVDEDFGRGNEPFTRFFSASTDGPNPAISSIIEPPFYAAPIVLSDLGTKGGLKTDAGGRVLRADGTRIGGLYAAGNTMASMTGHSYPSPGTPIGSCMVFSFLAARDMAAAESR